MAAFDVPRATYTSFKDSDALRPHPNTAEPNFATLFTDERAWNKMSVKLYRGERFPEGEGRHPLIPRMYGAKTQYDTDVGDKKSMATKIAEGGFSRAPTQWSMEPRFAVPPPQVGPAVGPGAYYHPEYHSSFRKRPASVRAGPKAAPNFTPSVRPYTWWDQDKPLDTTGPMRGGGGGRLPSRGPAVGNLAGRPGTVDGAGAGGGSGADAGEGPSFDTFASASGGAPTATAHGSSGSSFGGGDSGRRGGGPRANTAPAGSSHGRIGQHGSGAGQRAQTAGAGAGMQYYGRPQTRAQLRDLMQFYNRQQMAMMRRRLLKKRSDTETDPLVDHAERLSRSWGHRATLFPTSIDVKGPPLSTDTRFRETRRIQKMAAAVPGPGEYEVRKSFLKKDNHRRDPRNDFPKPTRRVGPAKIY